ncbi:MAG: hypothetical protein ACRES7_05780 [Gammaproteobacteria bacterium]
MKDHSRNFTRVLASRTLFGLSLAAVMSIAPVLAQAASAGQSGLLEQKLAAIKASTAANQQKLHHYTWTETSLITLNGNTRPPKQSLCSYGSNGKVQKTPIGTSAQSTSNASGPGSRLKNRIIEKKTAEMEDYMKRVAALIALYMPPNTSKMQQAFQKKNVSFQPGSGMVTLVFKNYVQPGDSMTLAFNTATKKISSVKVKTYLDSPQDGVSLAVSFASLPDGTNHASQTVIDAQAKNIRIVNTNSNYRKMSQ